VISAERRILEIEILIERERRGRRRSREISISGSPFNEYSNCVFDRCKDGKAIVY